MRKLSKNICLSKRANQVLVCLYKLLNNSVKISLNVVIVDYIDKVHGVSASLEELKLRRVHSVDDAPVVNPACESLVFPNHEGFMVHHCWLNYLLCLEYSPCNRIHIFILYVLSLITLPVYSLVGDHLVLFQVLGKWVNEFLWDEELVVSFLIDKAILGSPSK